MLRILLVEDEPLIQQHITRLINARNAGVIVAATGKIEEARVLIETAKPDVVLLDVQLKDGNGFDLLQSLPFIFFHLIFMTAYNEYAIRAIKFGALDYLLKPVQEEELMQALAKAAARTAPDISEQMAISQASWNPHGKTVDKIVLRSQHYIAVVPFEDIIYCEGNAGYTTFFLTGNRKELVTRSIKEYEELLPPERFIRTHQSYMVNIQFIDRYHKDGYLIMKTSAEVPVAVRKKESVINFISGISL